MNTVKLDSFEVEHSTKSVGEEKWECSCVTWKISNFSLRAPLANQELSSPIFHCSDAIWSLSVFPNELELQKSDAKVGTYLKKTYSIRQKHVVSMKVRIPKKGGEYTTSESKATFDSLTGETAWGFSNILCRSEVLWKDNGYLPEGVLTIICEISVSPEKNPEVSSIGIAETVLSQNLPQNMDIDTNALSKDANVFVSYHKPPTEEDNLHLLSKHFETLYTSQRFSDVILKAGKHEFPAHKLVLRSRSMVFEAMFEHDMLENRQATVDLIEMEADTVQDMLRYIYCGKVRHLSLGEALQLYVAADRYDLQELVLYCRKIILSELSINDICEVCAVADLHQDRPLMDAVQSLLSMHMKEVLKMDQWKAFAEKDVNLSFKLLQSAILNS